MKIVCLGAGSARTNLTDFHSSVFVKKEAAGVLIDVGDGISRALKSNNIKLNEISCILISHFHADHIAGLPLLITQMKIENRKSPLKIFVAKQLKKNLENFLNVCYLFLEKMPFPNEIIGFSGNLNFELVEGLTIKPIQNTHVKPFAEIDEEKFPRENFSSFSFLISENDRNFYYSADVGSGEDFFLFNEQVEAAFLESTHVDFDSIIKFARRHSDSEIFLTHIDDFDKVKNFVEELDEELRKRIAIAAKGIILKI